MGASLRGMAVWCVALFALGAGCGDADDLSAPPDAAAGTSGAGATGGTAAGTGGGGAGGTSASGGASAAGGSGGEAGTSSEDASADVGGSAGAAGGHTVDAASDFDGSADSGADEDGSTDANFCLPCPKTLPTSGSVCRPCSRPTVCTYNACNQTSGMVVTATCDESSRTWVLKSDPCNSFQCGAPPGGRRCNANQICVLPLNTCVDNPCGDEPFSCSCAQAACPGAGYRCLEQSDPRTISCSCLTC